MRGVKADCGSIIKNGDVISFSYGIPPVREIADVGVTDSGGLIATMRGNSKPHQSSLGYLKKCVERLYLVSEPAPDLSKGETP